MDSEKQNEGFGGERDEELGEPGGGYRELVRMCVRRLEEQLRE